MHLLAKMTVAEAVHFDGEARFFAKEIEIVNVFGMLPTEFVPTETPVTQPTPHELFRPGFFFAEYAGAFDIGHEEKVKDTAQK